MAETLSEKIQAINKSQNLSHRSVSPKKKTKVLETEKKEPTAPQFLFQDEYYADPNNNGWHKVILAILIINGILLALALGRFILFGV